MIAGFVHSFVRRNETDYGSNCFPPCFPASARDAGEAEIAPKGDSQLSDFFDKTGAGEGIRTLDPNLGKVVLYP